MNALGIFATGIGIIAMMALGLGQIVLAAMGADDLFGWWASFIVIVLAFGFRFTLPVTVFSYFGAVNVLGWPWWAGVLVALPGLIFMVPGVIAAIVESITDKVRSR